MDVRIRERLIGALVLVGVVVLLVPAVLKGPGTAARPTPAPDARSVEIPLEAAAGPAGNEVLVPEPEIVAARPLATAPEPAPAPDKSAQASAPAGNMTPAPESTAVATLAAQASAAASQQQAWAVQLGAFSSRNKAEELVARLRARGYAAFVLEYRAGGQLLHRVRVGPEQARERAVAIAERLRNEGYKPVVAPHP